MKRLLSILALIGASLTLLAPAAEARTSGGYWMLASDGHVYGFGGAADFGSPPSLDGRRHITPTPSGNGYWVLSEYGSLYNYGDAQNLGAVPPVSGDEKYTTMATTPDGSGYWLFTNKGRVLRFGNANFYGDMSGSKLNGPVLDAVATPNGQGYYMVGSDGGVFTFGNAHFHGSTGGMKLNKPVMSLAPDADGEGYWLVSSDGGIFAFDAPFFGSMGGTTLNKPISGIVASPTGRGYLMVAQDGGIFSFGDVPFYGSLGANPPAFPVVSVAAIGDPPPPAPDPVYDWVDVLDPFVANSTTTGTSMGRAQTPNFSTDGEGQAVRYLCEDGGGTEYGSHYSYGCSYTVYEAFTGQLMDMWTSPAFINPDTGNVRVRTLRLPPGRYYIEGQEFGTDTTWGVAVSDNVCVQYC